MRKKIKRLKHTADLCKNCNKKPIGKMHHLYCNRCHNGIHGNKKEYFKELKEIRKWKEEKEQ